MSTELTDTERADLEVRLQEMLDDLRRAATGADDRSATVDLDGSMGRLSRMDALQQQEMAKAQARQAERRLITVQRALTRFADDSYGDCLDCGEPIGFRRLRAKPDAPFCVSCTAARGA